MLPGPRQVGKTTLAQKFEFDVKINLAKVKERLDCEKNPEILDAKIQTFIKQNKKIPLVYIDEVQLVPDLMSEIQVLIDEKKSTVFINWI